MLRAVPSYRHHKPTGQAVVTLSGRDIYLGKWKSAESKAEYSRVVAEWLANDRVLDENPFDAKLKELLAKYWIFAQKHYRKNGEPTHELDNIRYALKPLKELYGHTLVRDFGPRALKVLQQEMIRHNLSRRVINSRIGKIKRV